MVEGRRIYKEPIALKLARLFKRILLIGGVLLLIGMGIMLRNQIVMASFPPINENEIISDLNQLTPDTKKLALEFLSRCEAEGLDVKIIETYRTQKRQDYLYAQGRNTDGPRVTWTKSSVHTRRRAFDIVKRGEDPYGDEEFFEKCAKIGEEVGLEAGHYWTVRDSGHFQNFNWWNRFWY